MTRGDLVSLVGSVAPFFMCLSSPTRFATHLILRWLSVLKNDLITIKPHLPSCFNSLLCLQRFGVTFFLFTIHYFYSKISRKMTRGDLVSLQLALSFYVFSWGRGRGFWGWMENFRTQSGMCIHSLYEFLSANPKIIVSHLSIHW